MPNWVRWILVLIGLLFIGGSILWYVWAWGRVSEAREWPEAQGRVVAMRVAMSRGRTQERDSSGRTYYRDTVTYAPVIRYAYRVGGRDYSSETIWVTSARAWSDPTDAEAFLADYAVGGPVTLVYNPADPSDAALIVEAPTPMIFLATAMGFGWLAAAWLFGPERPPRPVLPEGIGRQLLRNRRR